MHIKAKALLLVYWISKLKHIANWLNFNVLLDLVKPFHVKPTQMNTLQKHSKSILKHSLRNKVFKQNTWQKMRAVMLCLALSYD